MESPFMEAYRRPDPTPRTIDEQIAQQCVASLVQGGVYSPGLQAALQMTDREPGAVLSAIDRLATLNDNLQQLVGKFEANLDRLSGMRAESSTACIAPPVQDGEVNLLHSKISTSFDLVERLLVQADRLTSI